ncbi:propanol dehydrogenase [Brochothrix campestris FSL F6-1037]|uniref:Propanol dehydrogenase n=1 Tax=Brochothrix campestris FSL F6-1037 TaxID=1265861 RepID=W7CVM9_9LIST|nr:hypothetical protein [Brochothrix campestris]EUJ36978.1 propanol dehydrogenase [Brochothrix campestris FSL F6-1037]
MKKLQMQTTIYTGEGALEALATYTNKKIFIVTDPFMVSSGLLEQVMVHFDSSNTTAVLVRLPLIHRLKQSLLGLKQCKRSKES